MEVERQGVFNTTFEEGNEGIVVEDWRKEVFENTVRQFYFWSLLALTLMFGASLMANGWFMRERERRLTISADLIAQLYNAYVTSRARAFEVIDKHNRLVEKYNRLDEEVTALRVVASLDAPAETRISPDFADAKDSKTAEIGDGKETGSTSTTLSDSQDAANEVEAELRTKLEEVTLKLKRKAAQLQAKDNQITNLRSRLTLAHDSLQGERAQKIGNK